MQYSRHRIFYTTVLYGCVRVVSPVTFPKSPGLSALVGLNKIVFVHRNHKFNKQVQETQKQYAYLSVNYRWNDNYIHIHDGKMSNYRQKSKATNQTKSQKTQQQNGWMCVGSGESSGCYNITFSYTNHETVSVLEKTQVNKTFRTWKQKQKANN